MHKMFTILCIDVLSSILRHSIDKEKIYALSTCKSLDALKNKFMYYDKIDAKHVQALSYATNFKHVYHFARSTKIPKFTTHVEFHDEFNECIDGIFPYSVTHIKLARWFDRPIIGHIPDGTKEITFGDDFNQPIDGCFPSSLTHLTFGCGFNQPIYGHLPRNLTHLSLGYSFTQSIKNSIPETVEHLTFDRFELTYSKNLPSSIKYLTIDTDDYLENIPPSVTHLQFSWRTSIHRIPLIHANVTHLTLNAITHDGIHVSGHNSAHWKKQKTKDWIPKTVTHLVLGRRFFSTRTLTGAVPNTVTHLTLRNVKLAVIKGNIPSSVTHLTLYDCYRKKYSRNIPDTVKYVEWLLTPSFDC